MSLAEWNFKVFNDPTRPYVYSDRNIYRIGFVDMKNIYEFKLPDEFSLYEDIFHHLFFVFNYNPWCINLHILIALCLSKFRFLLLSYVKKNTKILFSSG